jgi:hypothetical protein
MAGQEDVVFEVRPDEAWVSCERDDTAGARHGKIYGSTR